MKRHAPILAALPMMFWIAQGCSSTTTTTPGDNGGNTQNADTDAGTATGGGGGGGGGGGIGKGGAPVGDGGGSPVITGTTPGTQLLAGANITLYGVTSDGYVLYGQPKAAVGDGGASTSLEVVSLAGGAPTVLAADLAATDDFAIAGMTVAYYQGVDQTSGIAKNLSVWTAKSGLKPVATNSIDAGFGGIFDASADGSHIIFQQNATATTVDIEVALSDGTSPVALVTGASTSNKNCGPMGAFGKAIAYASSCASGSATTAGIETLDTGTPGATKKAAATATAPNFVSMDDNGTHLVYIKNTNKVGTVAPFAGATSVAQGSNTAFAALNADASKLVYRTTAGALVITPAATATPTTLVASGVAGVLDLSTDFTHAVVNLKPVDKTTNVDIARADLNFASLTAAGAPAALDPAGFPVGFSSTGTHFFYLSGLPTTGQTPIATLKVHAAAGGAADAVIAKDIIDPKLVKGGTKVVFMENPQQSGQSVVVDLTSADGATAAAGTVVVQAADPGFELSGGKIVYTNAAKGLYAVAVP